MVKDNSKLKEAIRKSIHLSSLALPLSYRYILGYNRLVMFFILLGALVIALIVELNRLQIPTIRKAFQRLFGLILRKHEKKDFTGATFLLFSSLICVVFFNPEIAFLAMSYLSIGDTFAAIVGMSFGKRKFVNQKKSIEGSLGCFVSIMLFSMIFAQNMNPWIFFVGSITATIAELWKIPVDDNVKIPILSGIAMTLVHIVI
jgi:dolichol kinase